MKIKEVITPLAILDYFLPGVKSMVYGSKLKD
jgi:hypothetical protein